MVDPVTLWPVRSVSKSVGEPGVKTARTEPASAQPKGSATSLPKLVSMAAELARQGPPVDFARIAQLRQAIAQGSYAVDVDSIAHAMIGFFRTGD